MAARDRIPGAGPIRRAVPLVLAAAICVTLVQLVGWEKLAVSVGRARFDWFVPVSIAYVMLNFWIESAGLWVLFSRTVVQTPYKEVLIVRAVTQFLGSINVWLGQMGMGYYYAKRSGLPMAYLTGTFVLLLFVDLLVTFLFAGSFIRLTGTPFDTFYMVTVAGGLTMYPVLFLARRIAEKRLGTLAAASVWFTRTGLRQILAPMFLIPIGDLLLLVFARVLRFPLKAFYLVAVLWAFHVDVPLATGLLVSTFTILLGSIPITPQGVGLVQAVGLALFRGLGAPEDVLAALFGASAAAVVGNMAFGLYYLKGGLELMRLPPPPPPPAPAAEKP